MITQFPGIEIPESSVQNEQKRLTNQIWKLIPMKENEEDWKNHLDTIIEEVAGLGKVLVVVEDSNFLILLSKLAGLTDEVCENFMLYRKTVFRCIDLLNKVLNHE
ncbi:MAG: hypothetical protein NC218_07460 [Acetobacter sp.]|nr:hypothetical protein [Acetobacter sp.]